MNIALAFLSALTYGVSDFVGGYAARKHSALGVILLSYPVSAMAILLVSPAFGGTLTPQTTAFGVGSGIVMAVAILWFYAALAQGPMSVVSPITAVLVVALPVLMGLALNERLSFMSACGIVLAVTSVYLVSKQSKSSDALTSGEPHKILSRKVLLLTFGAGGAFACSFMLAHQIEPGSGLWPIFLARLSATILVIAWACGRSATRITLSEIPLGYSVAVGLLDAIANATMYLSLQGSYLSTTSVVISLYPVFTVALAVLVMKEKINKTQLLGMTFAITAIASISYSS